MHALKQAAARLWADRRGQVALAALGLVLTNALWGGNNVIARGVVDEIPPLAVSFWRWTLALVIVLPFAWPHVRRDWSKIRTMPVRLTILAFLSVGCYNSLLYQSAVFTSAINISIIAATMPVATIALALLLLGEPIRPRKLVGIAISFAGVLVVVTGGQPAVLAELGFNLGDLLMVGAMLAWAVYSVLLRRHPLGLHPVGLLGTLIFLGVLLLLPVYLIEYTIKGGFAVDQRTLLVFAYVGIGPSLIAFALWNHGVTVLGPTTATLFVYLAPIFTALFARIFLGEALETFHLIGGLMILAGFLTASFHRARNRATASAPP